MERGFSSRHAARSASSRKISRVIPGLTAHKPQGAFYLFVNCGDLIGRKTPQGKVLATEQDVVLYLLEGGVAVVVGAAYGMSPYFRMSIATDLASLEEACRRHAYERLALGHTADDQVELFFLRLLRGAGPEGVKGMWPARGTLVRPLLPIGKEVLLAWLKQEPLSYREDASNLDRRYLRNRLRLDLVPQLALWNPQLKTAVWRLPYGWGWG